METSERVHALDAVRALALLLGVGLHAAMSFVPGIGAVGWPIVDSSPSATLGALLFVIHTFRMTLFLAVAGYFAHLLFHRKGARGFWANRAKRVLAPLLIFWPLVLPAIVASMYLASVKSRTALVAPKPAPGAVLPFPLTHLWFLYVLLGLYALLIAARSVLLDLVHLPLVFWLQVAVQDWPLSWALKFPLVLGVAILLLLITYHGLVRSTWVGSWLNGRR